jgi:hypothetical protein
MIEYPQWARALIDNLWLDEARGHETAIIYFADLGDCLKIGQTNAIKARLRELRPYDLNPPPALGLIVGAKVDERTLHSFFRDERIDSKRELFRKSKRLLKLCGLMSKDKELAQRIFNERSHEPSHERFFLSPPHERFVLSPRALHLRKIERDEHERNAEFLAAYYKLPVEMLKSRNPYFIASCVKRLRQIIDTAKHLGIKLTNAELGSEICEAWAGRVCWAKVCWDEGRTEDCKAAIEDANRYAI